MTQTTKARARRIECGECGHETIENRGMKAGDPCPECIESTGVMEFSSPPMVAPQVVSDLAREHDALVHPDGSACPDGCDAPPMVAPQVVAEPQSVKLGLIKNTMPAFFENLCSRLKEDSRS